MHRALALLTLVALLTLAVEVTGTDDPVPVVALGTGYAALAVAGYARAASPRRSGRAPATSWCGWRAARPARRSDLARTGDRATALVAVKYSEYPSDHLDLAGPAWPWRSTALLVAAVGLAARAGLLPTAVRRARRRA